MAEINNSLAATVSAGQPAQPLDLTKTLSAIAQIDLAKAHAGLYGLQAQQEARKLQGFDYLKGNPTDYTGAIQKGLDPSVGNTLQTMAERERAYNVTPGRVSPESFSHLTSAGKNVAETGKIGVETQGAKADVERKYVELRAQHAQAVAVDPKNDDVWHGAVDAGVKLMPGSDLQKEAARNRAYAISDPNERLKLVTPHIAAGLSPADATQPHSIPNTEDVQTRFGVLGRNGSAGQNGGMPTTIMPKVKLGSVGFIPARMTPGQVKEQEAVAGDLAKELETYKTEAGNASGIKYLLHNLIDDASRLPTGKGANIAGFLKQWLQAAGQTIPGIEKIAKDYTDPIAAFEAVQKNAGQLTRATLKDVQGKAAVEYRMIQEQLPNAEMSEKGLKLVTSQMMAPEDYKQSRFQAATIYREHHKTLDGFAAEWNKNVGPGAFLFMRLPKDEQTGLKERMGKTTAGKKALESLRTQIEWINQHGLDEGL